MHLNEVITKLNETETRQVLSTFYENIWKMGVYKPTGAKTVWPRIEKWLDFDKALDVGCGSGFGIKYCRLKGKKVFGCDIAPSLVSYWQKDGISDYCKVYSDDKLPYEDNEFDLIVCNDVFEHIPEFEIDPLLKEIYRVGSDKFFLCACVEEESIPVLGEIHAHITVREEPWWFKKFEDNGFHIAGIMEEDKNKTRGLFHATALCVKDKEPYIKRERFINPEGFAKTAEEVYAS